MKITKHAQSCLMVETEKARILVDPGSFVFGQEGLTAADFPNINIMVITHEHQDHFDRENVAVILQTSNPTVIATDAVINELKETFPSGDFRTTGDGTSHDFIDLGVKILGYKSKHGPLPNGKPAPEVSGVVIDDGATRLYVPGDTIEFNSEVSNIDITAVPICGVVVFDIAQAKSAVVALNPRVVIPYHHDNDTYPVNPQDFVEAMADTAIKVELLKNGESINI
jgi:L-ascorbate metabolism protein UlaG (beta-lactamase superfamily)